MGKNSRSLLVKGQLLSSIPQLPDYITFFELNHHLNKIVLHQKYLVEGKTIQELSSQFGCAKTTVKKYLREFGLKKGGHTKHRKNVAYGEKFCAKSKKTKTHKTEKNIIQTIVQMYEKEGLGMRAIARVLSFMKTPTKHQEKSWDHSVVTRILVREGAYFEKRP